MIIENALKMLNTIHSKEAFEEFLKNFAESLSLKNYWYMIMPPNFDINRDNYLLTNNYPKEFVDEYLKTCRYIRDPVVINSFKKTKMPLLWKELFEKDNLVEDHLEQLDWARQFNITSGISCPIMGSQGEFSLLHFVIDENEKIIDDINRIKNILYCLVYPIYCKANDIFNSTYFVLSNKLTEREAKCLTYLAMGKTVGEISGIIHISKYTVNQYIANCLRKLNACSKSEAIAKSLLFNQINVTDLYKNII